VLVVVGQLLVFIVGQHALVDLEDEGRGEVVAVCIKDGAGLLGQPGRTVILRAEVHHYVKFGLARVAEGKDMLVA
jgi:hypothetical protein